VERLPYFPMDPTNPKDCSELDLRKVWRASYRTYGPAWEAAIEMGIDVGQLEYNLSLTPTERLLQHAQMTRSFELIHGAALPRHS
jgi:hypothetical protein